MDGKRRELLVCLRALYDRLHEPSAEYSQNFTRDALKDLLAPAVQGLINDVADSGDTADDELSSLDFADDKLKAFEYQLHDIAGWADQGRREMTMFDWLLDRIEGRVEIACTAKHPELIKAMNIDIRRAARTVGWDK